MLKLFLLIETWRKILLLGSGFVAAPFVEYILRRPENQLTIGMIAFRSVSESH